jgi:hypothetical protein
MTIDDKEIIITMLKNNGTYPEDPQAFQISSYVNDYGNQTYHVAMEESHVRCLYDSPHCQDIKILWTRKFGITHGGKQLIKEK